VECARRRTWWRRGRVDGGLRTLCGAAVVVSTATACASAPVAVPVPTFAATPPTSAAPAVSETGSRLPADCMQLLPGDELAALFGLPVDSLAVRTVLGTPSPSVGREERLTCTYTMSGPGAPSQGVVLRTTVGTYRDDAAARAQHERNVADERAGTSGSVQPELGTAAATVFHRGSASVLLTSSGAVTLDLDLPRPGPLAPADLLVDLARRLLARLTPGSGSAAP